MKQTVLFIAALALLLVSLDSWMTLRSTRTHVAALESRCEALATQAAEMERILADLSTASQRSPVNPAAGRALSATGPSSVDLARRLQEVFAAQSNILARLDRLTAQRTTEDPQQAATRRLQSIPVLEASLSAHERELAAARQQTAELLESLQVPADVSSMMPHQALAVGSLKPYWPYFEALRQRERAQDWVEKLRARLEVERMEAQIDAAGGAPR
jgi:hypothetical protein